MSDSLSRIRNQLAAFHESPSGFAMSLRNDFARLIVQRLEDMNWSQRDLARAIKKPDSFVSRLIHGKSNCELETVGEVLHALQTKPALVARDIVSDTAAAQSATCVIGTTGEEHGQEIILATETLASYAHVESDG